jgi:arabinose-5-phosphate isomerase
MSSPVASVADLSLARRVLQTEAAAILALLDRLDARFVRAVELVLGCRGRIIVTGVGKSGIIGRKIAATLASTGTPAFFLHPADAAHGDLGVIQSDDVVLALSYSGETDELKRVVETIKRLGVTLVAITGDVSSTLGQAADVALDCHVSEEACPLNLVPTASTTAALALGDALAMTVLVEKGFKPDDFANLHPGGLLGKRLTRARQVMHSGDLLPVVGLDTPMGQALDVMTGKGLGMTCIVDAGGSLSGVITDGDLRRTMARRTDILALTARDVMSPDPVTIGPDTLAVEALALLERRKITSVVVIDSARAVLGVVHLHDLWRTGMV